MAKYREWCALENTIRAPMPAPRWPHYKFTRPIASFLRLEGLSLVLSYPLEEGRQGDKAAQHERRNGGPDPSGLQLLPQQPQRLPTEIPRQSIRVPSVRRH